MLDFIYQPTSHQKWIDNKADPWHYDGNNQNGVDIEATQREYNMEKL